jgi:hypothetical protein
VRTLAHPLTHAGDETQPACSQYLKGGRVCRQEATQDLDIRSYQPTSEQTTTSRKRKRSVNKQLTVDLDSQSEARVTCPPYDTTAAVCDSFSDRASSLSQRRVSFATSPHSRLSISTPSSSRVYASNDHDGTQSSPTGLTAPSILSPCSVSTPKHLASPAQSLSTVTPFMIHEARLVHHFSEHLGRWLDCTICLPPDDA